MTGGSSDEVTLGLARLRDGDGRAADSILPIVYDELRRLASRYLRHQRPGHTLQTTALVHEAYLRLVDQTQAREGDRVHFVALAARAMRSILVDHARSRRTVKRGGARRRIPLDDTVALFESRSVDLLALDEALARLADANERQSRIVELRFFGGLTTAETADVLGLSTRAVERDWRYARVTLHRTLSASDTRNVDG
ncbi:MAG: sigma-70 family RNA polymerase sigma factor [Planctomycetes bacterium]|nr:sigma-70 family RNA polymerase sigma factor [Planctomycetota bacterium]